MVEMPMKLVIWGQEGVGKTTFSSLFPNPWFIDTERSTKWIPGLKSRQFQPYPKTWQDCISQLKMFKQQKPGDTLVIDTGDWLEAMLIKDLCNRKGWDSLGGLNDYGNSYNVLDKEFREFLDELNEISDMGIHIVITAHMTVRTFTAPDQMGSWDRYELKMQKKTSAALKEWADAILFLKFKDVIVQADKEGKKFKAQGGSLRVIQTVRSASWDAKNRFDLPEELLFENKKLPKEIVDLLAMAQGETAPIQPVQPQIQQPVQPEVKQIQPQASAAPEQISPQPAQEVPADPMANMPSELKKLMEENGVSIEHIEEAVNRKGFFKEPLKFEQYPPEFVEQMLIANFEPLYNYMLIERINLPF